MTASLQIHNRAMDMPTADERSLIYANRQYHRLSIPAVYTKAGPGGEFLTSQETLKRFRQYWFPGLLDRQTREEWREDGGTTLGQRLNQRVKDIIDGHQVPPLDPSAKTKLDEILAVAAGQVASG